MKKHLFWIYIAILEINMVISMLLQHLPRMMGYITNKEGMEVMARYDGYFKVSMIIMFLMFEVFFIASFFIDEIAAKRKKAAIIFVINLAIVSHLFMYPLVFFNDWLLRAKFSSKNLPNYNCIDFLQFPAISCGIGEKDIYATQYLQCCINPPTLW